MRAEPTPRPESNRVAVGLDGFVRDALPARRMHVAAAETAGEKSQRTPSALESPMTKWASCGGGDAIPHRGSRAGISNVVVTDGRSGHSIH